MLVNEIGLSLGQARLGPNTTARFAAVTLFRSLLSTTWNKDTKDIAKHNDDPTKEMNSTRYLSTP